MITKHHMRPIRFGRLVRDSQARLDAIERQLVLDLAIARRNGDVAQIRAITLRLRSLIK